jgi:3-phosphoshikimate 1-carboxyvinyltransferase
MHIELSHFSKECNGSINITGSKSISNRLLIIQSYFPSIKINNCSNSDDTNFLKLALKSDKNIIDINHAGTAMRFLTSFFSLQFGRRVTLTGSKRMQERPIKILVDALISLGAKILYDKNEGFPPLTITGSNLSSSEIKLPSNVSSQYISSLILIGPKMKNGLKIELTGNVTSRPYIKMTLKILSELGVRSSFINNIITVKPKKNINRTTIKIESDWSSASYYYSVMALCDYGQIKLNSFNKESLQGDCCLTSIYESLGVCSKYDGDTLTLSKNKKKLKKTISIDLINSPDIAQTIAVTCFGLGIGCELKGLHTLKIKETDRLSALYIELSKLGADISVTANSLLLLEPKNNFKKGCTVFTYEDHRMAMAFAPLSLKIPIKIQDPQVVNKSYPDFWKDFQSIGFQCIES